MIPVAINFKVIVIACIFSISLCFGSFAQAENAPTRAKDLNYGVALYNYHQGNYFDALTDLAVANEKGGIEGHGDHPSLVEGGLMLSYGMTREAKARFEQVALDNISPKSRNEAWYYLSKVFFLEGDMQAAKDASSEVDLELLEDKSSVLVEEFAYIQAQIEINMGNSEAANKFIDRLPKNSIWRIYLQYNAAITQSIDDQPGAIIRLKEIRIPKFDIRRDESLTPLQRELLALGDQILLSTAELQLRQGQAGDALKTFQQIKLDSPLSDQALFGLAISASTEGEFGLALEALKQIDSRELFNPWVQQTPYALGFLYEQLEEPEIALRAYETAALHYLNLQTELQGTMDKLSESSILQSLRIDTSGGEITVEEEQDRLLALGNPQVTNDSYGRLKVKPLDFGVSSLLAKESFQLALRDLHELYKLQNSLVRWERQLASFETMLDTRATQRERKIADTLEALSEQNAESWVQRYEQYSARVSKALAQEDALFFASEEQLDFQLIIDAIYANLELLPEGEDKEEFKIKADRMQGYLTWLLYDDYGVNRWAVERQLRELSTAIEEFKKRNNGLKAEIASGSEHQLMQQRVISGKARLDQLRASLDLQLRATRENLVALVRADLEDQYQQTSAYLVASREARARISDDLFREQNAPAEKTETGNTSAPDGGAESDELSQAENKAEENPVSEGSVTGEDVE